MFVVTEFISIADQLGRLGDGIGFVELAIDPVSIWRVVCQAIRYENSVE